MPHHRRGVGDGFREVPPTPLKLYVSTKPSAFFNLVTSLSGKRERVLPKKCNAVVVSLHVRIRRSLLATTKLKLQEGKTLCPHLSPSSHQQRKRGPCMVIVSFTMSLLHLIVAAWRHLISAFKSISHSFSTSPSASATSRTRVERHLPEWTWAQVQQPRTATALAGANRAYPSTLESVLVSPSPDRIYATPTERPAAAAQPNATSVIDSQGRSQVYNPPAISKGASAPSASRSRSRKSNLYSTSTAQRRHAKKK